VAPRQRAAVPNGNIKRDRPACSFRTCLFVGSCVCRAMGQWPKLVRLKAAAGAGRLARVGVAARGACRCAGHRTPGKTARRDIQNKFREQDGMPSNVAQRTEEQRGFLLNTIQTKTLTHLLSYSCCLKTPRAPGGSDSQPDSRVHSTAVARWSLAGPGDCSSRISIRRRWNRLNDGGCPKMAAANMMAANGRTVNTPARDEHRDGRTCWTGDRLFLGRNGCVPTWQNVRFFWNADHHAHSLPPPAPLPERHTPRVTPLS